MTGEQEETHVTDIKQKKSSDSIIYFEYLKAAIKNYYDNENFDQKVNLQKINKVVLETANENVETLSLEKKGVRSSNQEVLKKDAKDKIENSAQVTANDNINLGNYDSDFQQIYHSTGVLNDKQRELKNIHDFIFNALDKIKNEGNCEEKKIIRCTASVVTGFSSVAHRYVICLHIALALNRIFFITQKQFKHFGGLSFFMGFEDGKCSYLKNNLTSITNKCDFSDPKCYSDDYSFQINNDYKLLEFTREADFPVSKYMPGTLPANIETRLKNIGVDRPWHWFTSQLLGYLLMKPRTELAKKFIDYRKEIDFKHPVIGIHFRHGEDKKTEAKQVEVVKYFEKLKYLSTNYLNGQKIKVFVATDNINSYNEIKDMAKDKYDIVLSPLANNIDISNKRNDQDLQVLENIVLDLYFLTACNISIVTYTSNIGRLVWELKSSIYPYEPTNQVQPMDGTLIYSWYAYSATSSYYLAVKDNHEKLRTVDGNNITTFNKGTLFRMHKSQIIQLTNGKTVEALFMTQRNFKPGDGSPRTKGFVLREHVVEWPGRPKYQIDMP